MRVRSTLIIITSLFSYWAKAQYSAEPNVSKENDLYLFVGTYTGGKPDSGIYIFKFNPEKGTVKKIASGERITNPSFLTVTEDGHYIYACTESKMKNAGSVSSFYFDNKKSSISFLNKQPSMGENPVYISLFPNEKGLVVANYTEATISVFYMDSGGKLDYPTQIIHYRDSSIIKERQEASHIHAAVFSPDHNFIFITDLGGDKIISYKINAHLKEPLELNAKVTCVPGSGPRHLTFHPSGKFCYVVEELSEMVSAYNYKNGTLKPIQRISTRDSTPHVSHGSADIHISPDGKYLYASNRGDKNTITIYSIQQDGSLTLRGYQLSLGEHPRNFAIDPTGNFLLVANLASNTIVVFKRDVESGLLSETGITINVPQPSCLVFRKMK